MGAFAPMPCLWLELPSLFLIVRHKEMFDLFHNGVRQHRALRVLKRGGILVSAVPPVPESLQEQYGVRAAYFYVDVTTARLNQISELFETGKLVTEVGTVLPLDQASLAHEMLGGAPHKHGKIVLSMA